MTMFATMILARRSSTVMVRNTITGAATRMLHVSAARHADPAGDRADVLAKYNTTTLLVDKGRNVDAGALRAMTSEQLRSLNVVRGSAGTGTEDVLIPLDQPAFERASRSRKAPTESVIPKKIPVTLDPTYPTVEQLTAPLRGPPPVMAPLSAVKARGSPAQRLPIARQKRSFDEIKSMPLPTTYPKGITNRKQLVDSVLKQLKEPNVADATGATPFKYKYFMVTLRRSPLGLPRMVREVVKSIGLTKVNQMVFLKVGPRSSGAILRLKELLRVDLVNQIPPKYAQPSGFRVENNIRYPSSTISQPNEA